MVGKSGDEREMRILTRHPEGKQGVNISREKYDAMREAIVQAVGGRGDVPLQIVREEVSRELRDRFEGSISGYFTTVKLDLEARGIIERVPGERSQRIRVREVRN